MTTPRMARARDNAALLSPRRSAGGAPSLLLLAALCLALAPSAPATLVSEQHDDCAASRHFTDVVTAHTLAPWITARRKFTQEQATAHFRQLNGTGMAAPVVVHKGAVYLVYPLHPSTHVLPFQRVIRDLRVTAELYPELSFEAVIGMHDDPQSWDVHGARLPVWGFNRDEGTADILLPHHYVRPDQLCREQHGGPPVAINMSLLRAPFEERDRRLLGRFTHYCAGARGVKLLHDGFITDCPRTYFSYLAQDRKEVAGVALDVGPINLVRQDIATAEWKRPDGGFVEERPRIPLDQFARAKYVLVTDGQVSAGKFANALALGSVVFRPNSRWEQYFEPALVEYVHYVPVWTHSREDLLAKVEWLEREPELAQRIAEEGRRFACHHLTQHGRNCWWREVVRRYNHLMAYSVTDALVEERKRDFPMVRVEADTIRCNLPLGVPFAGICGYQADPPGWEASQGPPVAAEAAAQEEGAGGGEGGGGGEEGSGSGGEAAGGGS